jgi:hypothetical protein
MYFWSRRFGFKDSHVGRLKTSGLLAARNFREFDSVATLQRLDAACGQGATTDENTFVRVNRDKSERFVVGPKADNAGHAVGGLLIFHFRFSPFWREPFWQHALKRRDVRFDFSIKHCVPDYAAGASSRSGKLIFWPRRSRWPDQTNF